MNLFFFFSGSHAPAILEQLRHSNRGKTEMMKIMTKTMFSIITTQENQHFTEFDENTFSLKSTRGVYFFSLKYDETESSVSVYVSPIRIFINVFISFIYVLCIHKNSENGLKVKEEMTYTHFCSNVFLDWTTRRRNQIFNWWRIS